MHWPTRSVFLVAASCVGLGLVGCADGVMPELRPLSPWARREWQEDEVFGPTYHKKVADLAALRSSAAALSPVDREQISQQLGTRLKDESSPAMRMELVRTLGHLQTDAAQAALMQTMADENAQVRVVACQALGRRQTAESLESLGKAVAADADLDVRLAATRELGRFHDPAAAQALRPALDDRDAALQGMAMQSLRGVTGKREYANSVAAWRQYLDGGNPSPPPAPSIAESLQKYWYWY